MQRVLPPTAAVLLALLLGGGAVHAQGVTLYIARTLTAPAGNVTLGDIVRVAGAIPPEAREALSRTIAVTGDKVLYVPASQYLDDLEAVFGRSAIVVGNRTVVVPQGTSAQSQGYLLDRLADWLESQSMVSDEITEIAWTQGMARGSAPRDGTPVFRAQTSGQGITEVSFSLTDSAGSTVSGRASFAARAVDAAALRAGSNVNVVFHKGPITIEMPGKALGAAAPGQQVSVQLSDSRRTFTGFLTGVKEVQVDLP